MPPLRLNKTAFWRKSPWSKGAGELEVDDVAPVWRLYRDMVYSLGFWRHYSPSARGYLVIIKSMLPRCTQDLIFLTMICWESAEYVKTFIVLDDKFDRELIVFFKYRSIIGKGIIILQTVATRVSVPILYNIMCNMAGEIWNSEDTPHCCLSLGRMLWIIPRVNRTIIFMIRCLRSPDWKTWKVTLILRNVRDAKLPLLNPCAWYINLEWPTLVSSRSATRA